MLRNALIMALGGLACGIGLGLASERNYELGTGDTLRIKVLEWPELSGEFPVGPGGTIFLGLIGEVSASGLTPAELAHQISGRVEGAAGLDQPPSTSVEIITFRPFFIVGDVQAPGEYAYRPGMTVLHAISVAGGIYRRLEGDATRLEREAISTRGQLRLLGLKIDQLVARKARLESELAGGNGMEVPAGLVERQSDPAVRALLTEERLLFELQARDFAEQRETLEKIQRLLKEEIASLQGEIEMVQVQLDSARSEFDDVRSLVARGLTPVARQLSLERMVANIAGQQRSLESAILRARQNIVTGDQKSRDLATGRMQRILTEIRLTNAELEHAQQQIETTRQLLLEVEASGAVLVEAGRSRAMAYGYYLVRPSPDGPRRIEATELTPVEPGDIVNVRRMLDLEVHGLGALPQSADHYAGNLSWSDQAEGN